MKVPAIELKIPPKVWIPLALAVSGTLLFLYYRFKVKQREELAEAIAKKKAIEEEKVETKTEETVEVEETPVEIIEEVEDFTSIKLPQNVHLPALSFNNDWEVIPLLPTAERPILYRIFNQIGAAAVEVYLETVSPDVWQVTAEGMESISVPLHDATQLRAVIASRLQQISPVTDEKTIDEEE